MSACHGQGERIGVIDFDPILTGVIFVGEAAGVIGEDFVEAWRRLGGVHGDEQHGQDAGPLALGLAMHWLPGFYNGRGIAPQRFTADAVPFSMYLNQDKPLIGFWLLLACPWIMRARSLRQGSASIAMARSTTGSKAAQHNACPQKTHIFVQKRV